MMNTGKTHVSPRFFAFVGAALGRPLGFLFSLGGRDFSPGVRSQHEQALAPEESFSASAVS
jgi:hypothetical protein